MIELKHSKQHNIFEFAQIALSNALYIDGYCLKGCLEDVLNHSYTLSSDDQICLLKHDNEYVGCCVFLSNNNVPIQIYIKPKDRGRNFSLLLIENVLNALSEKSKNRILLSHGEFKSFFFFHKLIKQGIIEYSHLNISDQRTVMLIDLILFSDRNKLSPSVNDLYIMKDEAFCHKETDLKILLNKITTKEWGDFLKEYHKNISASWFKINYN